MKLRVRRTKSGRWHLGQLRNRALWVPNARVLRLAGRWHLQVENAYLPCQSEYGALCLLFNLPE